MQRRECHCCGFIFHFYLNPSPLGWFLSILHLCGYLFLSLGCNEGVLSFFTLSSYGSSFWNPTTARKELLFEENFSLVNKLP